MLVEILYFAGCPNHAGARDLVQRVSCDLGVSPEVREIEVLNAELAERLRFLGSPTIRVDGRDVEPGADSRTQFSLACRVYTTPAGVAGHPDEGWLRDALLAAG